MSDGTTNVTMLTNVVVTISVTSLNGNAVYTFSGTVR
jgi:ABC-type maltose transport system permease subunit